MYVACRQLRTRDCYNIRFSTHCATQPSIETSSNLSFSQWAGAYAMLAENFKARAPTILACISFASRSSDSKAKRQRLKLILKLSGRHTFFPT